jgi:predicted GH43/DUF377 family glycosyl hydrolase
VLHNGLCAILVPAFSSIDPDCDAALRELEKKGYHVFRSFGGSAIDQQRCIMATDALDNHEELIWIDADIGFDPGDVERLRSHKESIVTGLVSMKGSGGVAARYIDGFQPKWGKDAGLHEIQYAGCGFLYTRRQVYKDMRLPTAYLKGRPVKPFFIPMLDTVDNELVYLAEDFAFCQRARAAGYRVYADTRLQLRHYGRHAYVIDADFRPAYSARGEGLSASPWGDRTKMPGILVLMHTHNNADTVLRCLTSIEGTLKDQAWAISVRDSHSTDGTWQILQACARASKAAGWTLAQTDCSNRTTCLNDLIDTTAAPGFPAIMIMDPACQMMTGRLDLLKHMVTNDLVAAYGSYTRMDGRRGRQFKAANDFMRFPVSATVFHSSVLTGSLSETDAATWSRLESRKVKVHPVDTKVITTLEYPSGEGIIARQARIDRFFMGTSGSRVWLEIQPVELPGDFNFNAGMVRWKDQWLMAYRHDDVDLGDQHQWEKHREASIWIVPLDADFKPGIPWKVAIDRVMEDEDFQKSEDPRLFAFAGDLWLSFTAVSQAWQVSAIAIRNLWPDRSVTGPAPNIVVPYGRNPAGPGLKPLGWEKNWSFFEHDGSLHFIYGINPHTVVRLDGSKPVREFKTDAVAAFEGGHHAYEELRGGTPPVRVGDLYFSFFHSRFRFEKRNVFPHHIYVAGCYAFDAQPPFQIRKVSRVPIMFGDFEEVWGSAVVFPNGAVIDRDRWIVSYGHNDRSTRLMFIDHHRLLESMYDT